MGSIDQIKHNRITARVLLAASALGIAGLIGLSAASADSISHTGPHSKNYIVNVHSSSVVKSNENVISVTNSSSQTGSSGDANVKDNTKGGSATSGDVNNSNSTTTTIVVVNK